MTEIRTVPALCPACGHRWNWPVIAGTAEMFTRCPRCRRLVNVLQPPDDDTAA